MKKNVTFFLFFCALNPVYVLAQSMNCATATSINLSSGSACVNGTNLGAVTDNTLYGTCNATPVDVVWYTYVANGSNNTFTVDPGTMTNAEIIIYTGNCPTGAGAQLEYCTTATGGNNINTTWGMVAGQQVWVGVASTTLNDGTFQLCINSTPPAPGPGNTCAQAVPICALPYNQATIPNNSSGQAPACFGSAPQQDVFIQFTITQSGVLAWTATCPPGTEYDWALWDISAGCPGTLACCNYNYASGSGNGFGMQNSGGNAPCGTSALGNDNEEYSPTMNVTCGETYAIQISNYSNDNNGFNLSFTNSTAQIGSNATFTVTPTLVCGASLNATINDGSTGDCAAVWDYGDGSANYNGGNPPSHNYTTPGTYAITETIGGACPSTHTEFVQLLAPLAATVTATNTGCSGSCTGTASVTAVTGGDGIYTYSWAPGGQTTSTISGICAGSYTATVSNALCGTSVPQVVNVISAGSATVTVNSASICSGNNTTLTANGGTTYTWSPATGLSGTSGASVTASPTTTTVYTVTGANGSCTATATSTVTVTPTPTVTVNNGTICNGGSTTLTANGATTYSWSPGTGLSATTGASVSANPTVTTVYTVTGANGTCTSTATSTVSVVTNPTVTVNTATICAGQQTATLTANGATTYVWSPATGLSATTGSMVTANPGATTAYTITGTVGTCTAVTTTTVNVNSVPVVGVNSATICAGQQTATLTANGANTYSWSPATGLSATTGTSVTGNPGLSTNYTVTGTDGNGCVNTATLAITVNPLPTITVNDGIICNGGSIALNANGASTYTWSPGTGLSATTGASVNANPATTTQYTVTGTDANNCVDSDTTTVTVVSNPTVTVSSGTICAGQQTATLTANGASTYNWSPATGLSATTGSTVTANPGATTTYTITGTVGTCTAVGTSTVTVNPLPIVGINSGTICLGQQTATLTANGASTYSWSPATGLSGTSGASVTANPGSTTNYTITGTDGNGCVNTATASVLVNPLPNVNVNSGLICNGNSLNLNANGASTYAWSPPGGLSATTGASVSANPGATTVYTVTGTDANNCVSSVTSTVTVANNPTVTVNTGTICLGQGTATLTANGASTYAWSPASGLSATTGSVVSANPNVTTTYTITGTIGTCTAVGTTTVTVNPLPVPVATSNTPCVNQSLNLTGNGGTGYSWNGPNSFSSITQNPSIPGITASAAGVYTLTVVDANFCVNTTTLSVIINPLPVVTANGATVCENQTINLSCTPNGAVSYSWSGPMAYSSNMQNPGITGATANMAGNYVVTVTDGNGCVNANVAVVVVNPLPIVTVNSGTICAGQSTATLTALGANTYAWAPPSGLSSTSGASVIANPGATSAYTVTGTDVAGCQNTATLSVLVNPAPVPAVGPLSSSGCAPVCVNFNNTSTSSGNCSWNFGDGASNNSTCTPSHCFTGQGTYSVVLTITDNNGCVGSSGSSVTVYPVPDADFYATPQPTSILDPIIQFYDASGNAVITSWTWNFGDPFNNGSNVQNPTFPYSDPGNYPVQLIVISDFGCVDSITRIVIIDEEFAIYVPNAFSPNSDGLNDVFLPRGIGVVEYSLYIFDRWGNQVFYTEDFEKGWDGTFMGKSEDIVQEDVYVWKIEVKNSKKEKKLLAGQVSLLK